MVSRTNYLLEISTRFKIKNSQKINNIKLVLNDIIRTVLSIVKITVVNIIFIIISCIQNHYSHNEFKSKF